MSDSYPRFLHWGNYKSEDLTNPDILEWTVTETETFETKYAICVNAKIDNEIRTVPLYNFSSANKQLLNLWNDAIRDKIIKKGKKFTLHTWLEQSKRNKDRKIRRSKFVF